jgi:diguanylate cyclase (GGDEF)-like protein
MLAGGLGLNAVGDTFNLFQGSLGSSYAGSTINAIAWPTAILVMSMAVWLRPRPSDPLAVQRPTGFLLPELAGVSALAILFVGNLQQTSRAALGFAACTLIAVGIRLALSARTLRALSLERRRQSITDELTGLGNRRHLFQVLDAFFADQGAPGLPDRSVAFLFVDLNHFKEINDSFGHPAGDELLRQLGPRLTDVLRDSDLAVRLGGDEFAVLLIDGEADYPTRIAERLAANIEQPFLLGSVEATIGASIGVANAPADAVDGAGLIVCADVAMYRAKLSDTRYAVFTKDLDQRGNGFSLAEELRAAIDEQQLVLHYQPQLDLRSGKVTAVEALVRWDHPNLGLLQPLTFLPLAEEAGLMRPLTAFILDQALTQCAAWRIAENRVAVSVNISATNLVDPGFTDLIEELLDHHDLPPEALVLEITETSIIAEFDRSRLIIQQLHDLGLVVSIDDFGAGFTSLAYLNKLAIGELKLDRTFLADLTAKTSERDSDLIRATIQLGHSLGLRIVAEGVEDAATLALLRELRCDLAQGYFISKPKPARELNLQSIRPEQQTPHLALARTT